MIDVADPVVTTGRLEEWAAGQGAAIGSVRRLDGHSGVSWAFDLLGHDSVRRLVLRLAPPGVRGVEGADVLRQAPVLRAAGAAGIPVPQVVATGYADGVFGTDWMIVEFVAGIAVPDLFRPGPPPALDVPAIFQDAAAVLASIHTVPWQTSLAAWDAPRTLEMMVAAFVPALRRADDDWARRGEQLRLRLLDRMPDGGPVGLVHNDFYSNNWIIDAHRPTVRAVLDWETACIGPVGVDLGWLAMMYDRPAWSRKQRPDMSWHPAAADLIAGYAAAGGVVPTDLGWFRAFSGLRLVSGISYYLRLHRRGHRVDDTWEGFALSVPALLDRAFDLLG